MTDLGQFANLVGVVTTLVAASGAITLAFMKRAKWQPPHEAVPSATARVAALMTSLAIAMLYVFGAELGRGLLAAIAAVLFAAPLAALVVSIVTNTRFSFYTDADRSEPHRILGGDQLTAEAKRIERDHGQTVQQMLFDAQGDVDLVWTRSSRASVQVRSALGFIVLIAAGASSLAAAGMLVSVSLRAQHASAARVRAPHGPAVSVGEAKSRSAGAPTAPSPASAGR